MTMRQYLPIKKPANSYKTGKVVSVADGRKARSFHQMARRVINRCSLPCTVRFPSVKLLHKNKNQKRQVAFRLYFLFSVYTLLFNILVRLERTAAVFFNLNKKYGYNNLFVWFFFTCN